MQKTLLYYNPHAIANYTDASLPGIERFSYFFKVFNFRMPVIDRTNTLTIPIRVRSLFPLPHLRPTKSLEEICNERAIELLRRAQEQEARLYVFWSGGIDSTLVLVSLLKNADAEQKKNITIFLSEESITENPRFYAEHIRGKLSTQPSDAFPVILGSKHIITNGELNDQLFGSNLSSLPFMEMFGNEALFARPNRDRLFKFYDSKLNEPATTNFYLDLFDRLTAAAPVPIETQFHYFWWLLFALEWQPVYMRALPFTLERNAAKIKSDYLGTNLTPFFGTEEFQLWSMNNLDKRIKGEWRTFKWPCKDIIYDYTKDIEYRDNKLKVNSNSIWQQKLLSYNFIDEDIRLHRDLDTDSYTVLENDFTGK